MGRTLVTAPAEEPLSLSDAKAHLRLEHDDDDTLVGLLIQGARQYLERALGRSLVTQTWDLTLDDFYAGSPGGEVILLPGGPVQSVTSITYYDSQGTSTVLSSSLYLVDTSCEPARISPSVGGVWPGTQSRMGAVVVRYVVGFGAASAVPQDIKAILRLLVGHWYENREGVVTGTISTTVGYAIDALIDARRLYTV